MKFFPDSALKQMEFDKVMALLEELCKTEYAKTKAGDLRIHTRLDIIQRELQQTHEYKLILLHGQYFPNDHALNISREIRLLSIPGAVLTGEQFILLRKLADDIQGIFRWFDQERRTAYPALANVIAHTQFEKKVIHLIDEVLDENGVVRDNASEELNRIRMNLYRKRSELRRVFDRVLGKLNKAGYVADIEESFLNGRRVVALHAEHKRQVKGILHGESDTRRTAYIEPEETIPLNNEIFSLENEESSEVYRILRELTAKLSAYADLLKTYHDVLGEFDFIRGKARLAVDMDGQYPLIGDKPQINLKDAYHPLLLLYNKQSGKTTIPVDLTLHERNRILVISGPNAGGKTVTMKTVGLLQLMIQSGLLVPVHPNSEFGIFKQTMIHIGDTQSIEFELSTYSSHLRHMKHFIEHANGRTLFFIDELGSGSDPNLGGAFAEVIMEELARKHAFGIVTTHYLNLKVMANKTAGILNGAMAFDEKNLQPLYKLTIGKPGSSYTFSIAERIGLDKQLIDRARNLVEEDHFRLDKLLNRAEQDLQQVQKKERELKQLLQENEKLKKEMQQLLNKEKHNQQVELLKQQNKITEERIVYLKEMERKLRQIVFDWRKAEDAEDKKQLMKQLQALLFKQKEKQVVAKARKKINDKYEEVGGEIVPGVKVLMKKNHQVGQVQEIRGRKAVVKIGILPMQVSLDDLVVVEEKANGEE